MTSILSKRESSFIKGILIILVILGHNFIISQEVEIRTIIVPFDVFGFFAITFLYGIKNIDFIPYIKNLIKGIFPTYFTVLTICTLLYCNIYDIKINPLDFLQAAFLGGDVVKKISGFLCLWFFPAFFYFSILRYLILKKKYYWIITLASIFFFYLYVNDITFRFRHSNAILSGLYFATICFFINIILRKFYSKYLVIASFFISISLIFTLLYFPNIYFYSFFLQFTLFILLVATARNKLLLETSFFKFFETIGHYSLYMYLSHMLIFRGIIMLSEDYFSTYWQGMELEYGIILYCMTLILSFGFSYFFVILKSKIYNNTKKASNN